MVGKAYIDEAEMQLRAMVANHGAKATVYMGWLLYGCGAKLSKDEAQVVVKRVFGDVGYAALRKNLAYPWALGQNEVPVKKVSGGRYGG